MKYLVTDIEWDLDEPVDPRQFPEQLVVFTDDPERIAGLISDDYGFCIRSMKTEEVPDED